jgi:hypothetical protein
VLRFLFFFSFFRVWFFFPVFSRVVSGGSGVAVWFSFSAGVLFLFF